MSDGRKSTTANIDHKDSSSSSSLSRANKTLDTFYSPVLRVSNSSALGIAQSQKVARGFGTPASAERRLNPLQVSRAIF
ncbi:hypothetical protein TNIN_417261 [Trichonephila inaurata madagascariensis]|uniref:Uncharacterized protein n=1 Tax=Trichonephila inaurata madagascariensis TaxID=2747483 RepID=A0A8X6XEA1_9ARAC|nr:hypothetical protein TNIN_417261 [Trichonephila inaurata madagascariensis]